MGEMKYEGMKEELYKEALEQWGEEFQLKLLVEEMGEAIVAVSKLGRNINGASVKDVIDELTDVEIMVEQANLFLGDLEEWNESKERKLYRLKKYLEGGECGVEEAKIQGAISDSETEFKAEERARHEEIEGRDPEDE